MTYLYIKSLHIIFVVSWMAGLFYIVRLFVYHVEANDKPEEERLTLQRQFTLMEHKLWYIITTPAMVLTVLTGLYLMLQARWYQQDWMLVKLGFVAGLLTYHFICQRILDQFKQHIFRWSSFQLRIWNELATILLVAIVFTVILKSTFDWIYGIIGLILFSIIILSCVRLYRNYRTKNNK
ncbi:MAG: CopD family protein [Sphingobacteriaceae bacterium]|jgi:putative membrane protein|nr:MAG: CopD family protein [Pedobacter sp.]